MNYSSDADLVKEMSNTELAILSGDDDGLVLDLDRIAQARLMGDSLIESTLRGRYGISPPAGDNILKTVSIDLTVYYLNEYRYRDSVIPPGAIRRRMNALETLEKIKNGELVIDGYSAGLNSPPLILSNNNDKERYFDKNTLDSFFPNS